MSRRGHNEGSIYQLASGSFRGAVTIPGTGKRKYFSGRSKAEVRAKVAEFKLRLSQGITSLDSRQSMEQFLTRWLQTGASSRLRPHTVESYNSLLHTHILPVIGGIGLNRLTPQHVESLLSARRDEGASQYTLKNIRALLRAALNQAVRWGMVQRNAAALVELREPQRRQLVPWSATEAKAFLACVESHRLRALFVVALFTGMRRGEVLGLRWSDVDWNSREVRVEGSLQRINGTLKLVELKTEKSRRSIRVPDAVLEALRRHKVLQAKELLKAGSGRSDPDLVFTTPKGTPIDPRNLHRQFVAVVERSGVRRQRFHDLRHAFATLQLEAGIPARVVMERLGHTQIGTTLDIYSHVTETMQDEAAGRLGEMLGG